MPYACREAGFSAVAAAFGLLAATAGARPVATGRRRGGGGIDDAVDVKPLALDPLEARAFMVRCDRGCRGCIPGPEPGLEFDHAASAVFRGIDDLETLPFAVALIELRRGQGRIKGTRIPGRDEIGAETAKGKGAVTGPHERFRRGSESLGSMEAGAAVAVALSAVARA